jgi:hypothetical protein
MKYVFALLVFAGCGAHQVKVAPVKVEPIHLTIDVNVNDKTAADLPAR